MTEMDIAYQRLHNPKVGPVNLHKTGRCRSVDGGGPSSRLSLLALGHSASDAKCDRSGC
jgi:hypothetical protein